MTESKKDASTRLPTPKELELYKREKKSETLRKFKGGLFDSRLNELKQSYEHKSEAKSKSEAKLKTESKIQAGSSPQEEKKSGEVKSVARRNLEFRAQQLAEKINNIEEFDPEYFTGSHRKLKTEVLDVSEKIISTLPNLVAPLSAPDEIQSVLSDEENVSLVENKADVKRFAEEVESSLRKAELHLQLAQIEKRALDVQENDYHSLMESEKRIKRQIKFSLNFLLKEQFNEIRDKNQKRKVRWLNLYALACMMSAFHESYNSREDQRQEYETLKADIKTFLEQGEGAQFRRREVKAYENPISKRTKKVSAFVSDITDDVLDGNYRKVHARLKKLMDEFFAGIYNFFSSVTNIRNLIGFLNIWRIYWIFARNSIISGLKNSSIQSILLEFDKALKGVIPVDWATNTNFEAIIAIIKAPRHLYDLLSIGLFTVRFAGDIITSIKHVYKPTDLELDARGVLSKLLDKKVKEGDELLKTAIFRQFDIEAPDEVDAQWFQKHLKKKNPKRISHEQIKALLETIEEEVFNDDEEHDKLNLLQEYQIELDAKSSKRSSYEFRKRKTRLANDGAWAFTNFLCNYDYITGFTDPVGIGLTTVFLVFDMSVHLWNLYFSFQDYKDMKMECGIEIKKYKKMLERNSRIQEGLKTNIGHLSENFSALGEDDGQRLVLLAKIRRLENRLERKKEEAEYIEIEIETQQKLAKENELEWRVNQRTYAYLIIAALILTVGFPIATTVSPLFFFMASTFAVAMYLSVDQFTAYKEKSLQYDSLNTLSSKIEGNREAREIAQIEYKQARWDFGTGLAIHAIAPVFLITAWSVSWPIGLCCSALLIGYKLWDNKSKHATTEKVKDKTNRIFSAAGKSKDLEPESVELDSGRSHTSPVGGK